MKMFTILGALALSTIALAEKSYHYKDISADDARLSPKKERTPGSEKSPGVTTPKKINAAKTIEEKIEDSKNER